MSSIDNKKFGVFLTQLRKQKGYTQKELAEKLFISDKAVSKWERGLSMPDVALLPPLANILDVTVTELLSYQKINETGKINMQEVGKLVSGTIHLSEKEQQKIKKHRQKRIYIYLSCICIVILELTFLRFHGYSRKDITDNILTFEILCLFFGGWICFFAKEKLPTYYDENKIHTYSDGIFRMNMIGINFNNKNWPYILRSGRFILQLFAILIPVLYFLFMTFLPSIWNNAKVYILISPYIFWLIDMIIIGKHYK